MIKFTTDSYQFGGNFERADPAGWNIDGAVSVTICQEVLSLLSFFFGQETRASRRSINYAFG